MKVLLTGATGQLGQALIATKPPGVELIATSRSGGAGLLALDLATPEACRAAVQEHCPDWVLNAGAYTAVDRAESEPALAQAVNADAPAAFAEALAATGGRLLQVSTDFVFNGAQGSPYRPEQAVDPLGAYGASKAAGEAAALHRERQQLGVVADQVGCPTSTATLSAACWRAIGVGLEPAAEAALPRILHWSDAGVASWYDFAVAIGELGVVAGLLERAARVLPISTADYPTPARRPSYSLLDCTTSLAALGIEPLHWRAALAQVLSDASPTLSPSRQAA
jgi:dTDP-4-dehydrorhamnose reductase